MIIELASIAGLIAGIYVAANFSEVVGDYLTKNLELEGTWVGYSAFFITFIGVVIGVYALARVLERAINLVALKLVNKLLGLVFGIVKMLIIISIVVNLLGWVDQHIPILQKSEPDRSLTFRVVKSVAPALLPILTDSSWLIKAEQTVGPLFEEDDSSE